MGQAKTLMIQGTASSVGKSLLTAALCRIYSRRGIRVAPFKAQNMALNSWVTPDGLEIGRAQALQAFAARVDIDVRMNPILLKPEGDSVSQVVLNGKAWKRAKAGEYWNERDVLWPAVTSALDSLRSDYELVIIEGAGSPAEINLRKGDIVNMAVALYANAPVLLVGDIDRGGVFASFVGTLALLEEEERALVKAFIINKFRGDLALLSDGLTMLADRTGGRPTLAVVPWIRGLALAEEDSTALDEVRFTIQPEGISGDKLSSADPKASSLNDPCSDRIIDIAVIRFPRISNFDDVDALASEAGVHVRFISSRASLGKPDAIILPGSKSSIADLAWLEESGLGEAVRAFALRGGAVVGLCGGYQMLGKSLSDPLGAEGGGVSAGANECAGLGLLGHETVFGTEKSTRRTKAVVEGGEGAFKLASGALVEGYEVHMGMTSPIPGQAAFRLEDGSGEGARTADGRVWGTYLHGVFDRPGFRRAWLRSIGWAGNLHGGEALSELRDRELDRLADQVETAMDMKALDKIIGLKLA